MDAALQDLQRIFAVADPKRLGPRQAPHGDLAAWRLPGTLRRALPAPVPPRLVRIDVGIERGTAVVADPPDRFSKPVQLRASPSRPPDARDTRRWRECRCSAHPPGW